MQDYEPIKKVNKQVQHSYSYTESIKTRKLRARSTESPVGDLSAELGRHLRTHSISLPSVLALIIPKHSPW